MLELLSALYNGEMRPVRLPEPDTDLGRMLPYRRVSFGLDAIELRGAGGSSFAALLSLKDYPDSTAPGLTDALLRLPCEMVLTESYAPCDRQLARERIDLAIRRLKSADEEAMAERREMGSARDALGVGAVGFGDHHLSVLVRSDRLEALDEATAACAAALSDAGAIAVREDVNLEPGFWGQFPGNEAYLVRRALISSANMACFGSLHGFALGQASGNHWGEAVTLLQTTSATPFFFNFHNGDLGNFTVIGPSGSGKTVVMNFLAAQAQKFAPAHRPVRQGSRRRSVRARHRRHLQPHRRRASHRLQPAGLPDSAGQPRLPARLAGRAARRQWPRGAGDHRRRGRCRLCQRSGAAPPVAFPRAAGRQPPAASRAISPAGSMPGWPMDRQARRARLAVRQCRGPARPVGARRSAST